MQFNKKLRICRKYIIGGIRYAKVKQNIKQYTNDFKEIYDISSILKYAIILNIALFGIEKM